ncbi:MAG: YCF48-related protein [Motiliproteus sp.]|nr:YCF48-related protein [Motiliproteus sp.]MCW9051963.1 YCF48-related protein [Motiliproteus sp.]
MTFFVTTCKRPFAFWREHSWLLLCALVLFFGHISNLFAADEDRLNLPALATKLAHRSLLLDLDRAGERLFAAGERGHIIYSEDQGSSWQQATVPVSSSLTAISFVDANTGWAVGHDGVVLKSSDGGGSWVKQLDGYQINRMVLAAYSQQMQQLRQQLEQLQDQEADTEELEITIEDLEIVLEDAQLAEKEGPTKPLLDLLFLDPMHGWVIGSYGLILETHDGGSNWLPVMTSLDNPDGFHLNTILRTSRGDLLIAGEGGVLFRSQDEGGSWQRLDSPYEGSYYAALETQPAGTLLVVGLRGRAFRSEDGGDSWLELDSATRSTLSAALQLDNGDLLLAGGSGSLSMQADSEGAFFNYVEPQRRGFTALLEASNGDLVLSGQGGITHVKRQQFEEAMR